MGVKENANWIVLLNTGRSFVAVDEEIPLDILNSGEVLNSGQMLIEDIPEEDLSKNATFADVITYLIDKNAVKLNGNKDIKFDYIKYNNVNYSYYRTAYSLWMIGKTLNPSKNLLCETFVVMMWLAEKWNVWSYADIKQAYWNYAKTNNKLPDCNYWKFLTMADLK